MQIDFLANLKDISSFVEVEANVSTEEAEYWCKTVLEALYRCTSLNAKESLERITKAVDLLRDDIGRLSPSCDAMLVNHFRVILIQIEAELKELRSFTDTSSGLG